MLEAALHPNLTGSDESVRDKVLEREAAIDKYENVNRMTLNGDVQIATLLKAASDDHRRYPLQVVGNAGSSKIAYKDVRDGFFGFLQTRSLWKDPDTMDIGAIQGGGTGRVTGKKQMQTKGNYTENGGNGGQSGSSVSGKGKGGKSCSSGSTPDGESKKFDGDCRWFGRNGHREVDCWVKAKGGARVAKKVATATAASADEDETNPTPKKIQAATAEQVTDED